MSEVTLLFSGQGAQAVGMGYDFYQSSEIARTMFASADRALGMNLSEVMFRGPADELTMTSRCQPALYLHGLIALKLLQDRLPELKPVAAAGLSLGEFTAHAAAETFSFETGLRLVARRGAFMEEACNATEGAMAALIGGDEEAARKLADSCAVDIANFNAPGQIVISGSGEGIRKAVSEARDYGFRKAIPLKVAGAYHSRLMQSAQEKLATELSATKFHQPKIPVVCNFGAAVISEQAEIRKMLEQQVTGSVRWTDSIKHLISLGNRSFIELGPGRVLAGLVAKIDPEVSVISIEDLPSLDEAAATLTR